MKNIFLVLLILSSLSLNSVNAEPPVPGDWNLIYDEPFDDWNEAEWNNSLPNGSLQIGSSGAFFLPENVHVANGNLILTSKRETKTVTDKKGDTYTTKWTSGYADTFGKVTPTYGYFEARMKMPEAKGLHPAFWLMPSRPVPPGGDDIIKKRRSTFKENGEDGYWGKGMEIDIMEHLTKWDYDRFHYATHWNGYKEDAQSWGGPDYDAANMQKGDYVNFGLLWEPGLLVWYANGVEVARQETSRIADVPMSMIFSTEMGGWAGCIYCTDLPDSTYIDYVKVWQKAE